jgi:hypothetical protein
MVFDRKAYMKAYKQARRNITDALKAVPCADCGLSYPPFVMDFDHVKGEKTKDISNLVQEGASLAALMAEIDKCEVVCANCHRIRTYKREQRS